ISAKYLEQLTIPLRRAGLIQAERGPNGGYQLAKSAAEISAHDIVEAVEGSLDLIDCIASRTVCDRTDTCAARKLWGRVGRAISEVLADTTLADLREEQRTAQAGAVPCYQI
nr:Rrf2 family transcriptional regulator [Armatimonadota bacterium]NIO97177.1 Rrf2 family transcriptional regulator [Armatimonadota bacterium]